MRSFHRAAQGLMAGGAKGMGISLEEPSGSIGSDHPPPGYRGDAISAACPGYIAALGDRVAQPLDVLVGLAFRLVAS